MLETRNRISDFLKKAIGLPPTSGCCGGLPSHGAGKEPQPPADSAAGCCAAPDRDDSPRRERMETGDADKR